MSEWIWSLIGAVGAPLVVFVWQSFLKRETTEAWGRRVGVLISTILRQRFGVKGGESIRDRFASTVEDFVKGLLDGLKSDA
jgi:hypothetical protein